MNDTSNTTDTLVKLLPSLILISGSVICAILGIIAWIAFLILGFFLAIEAV